MFLLLARLGRRRGVGEGGMDAPSPGSGCTFCWMEISRKRLNGFGLVRTSLPATSITTIGYGRCVSVLRSATELTEGVARASPLKHICFAGMFSQFLLPF